MRRPPEASKGSAPKGHRWRRRSPWDPRKPLSLTVKSRGGAECWYEVHARGDLGRVPGSTSLHDLMTMIYNVQ